MRYWIAFKCACGCIRCLFRSWEAKQHANFWYRLHGIGMWFARKIVNDEELFNDEKLHEQTIELLCLDKDIRKEHVAWLDMSYQWEETAMNFYVLMRRALACR